MPLREGLTMEDFVQQVVTVAMHPQAAREAGLAKDTPEQREREVAASNFGVFVLQGVGLTIEEIRAAYDKYR